MYAEFFIWLRKWKVADKIQDRFHSVVANNENENWTTWNFSDVDLAKNDELYIYSYMYMNLLPPTSGSTLDCNMKISCVSLHFSVHTGTFLRVWSLIQNLYLQLLLANLYNKNVFYLKEQENKITRTTKRRKKETF